MRVVVLTSRLPRNFTSQLKLSHTDITAAAYHHRTIKIMDTTTVAASHAGVSSLLIASLGMSVGILVIVVWCILCHYLGNWCNRSTGEATDCCDCERCTRRLRVVVTCCTRQDASETHELLDAEEAHYDTCYDTLPSHQESSRALPSYSDAVNADSRRNLPPVYIPPPRYPWAERGIIPAIPGHVMPKPAQ